MLFYALFALNNYINTLICIRIPVFASILINTAIYVLREKTAQRENAYVTVDITVLSVGPTLSDFATSH